MALNLLGGELKRPDRPVTLPRLALPDNDQAIAEEATAAAIRIAERRVIRAGADAWLAIGKVNGFDAWKTIGKALAVGKAHALKVSDSPQAWGSRYSRAFNDCVKLHGFERMPKSVRSVAIELAENAEAITVWRNSLLERQRRRLIHPLSVTRRWRAATTHNGKSPTDLRRDAVAAWKRFVSCVEALPPEQAWQQVQAQAAAAIGSSCAS